MNKNKIKEREDNAFKRHHLDRMADSRFIDAPVSGQEMNGPVYGVIIFTTPSKCSKSIKVMLWGGL